jgi:hypothetical protein
MGRGVFVELKEMATPDVVAPQRLRGVFRQSRVALSHGWSLPMYRRGGKDGGGGGGWNGEYRPLHRARARLSESSSFIRMLHKYYFARKT